MSLRRTKSNGRSASVGRKLETRFNRNETDFDSSSSVPDLLPNVLPELQKFVRKLLPQEIPLNIHVRNVKYIENSCEHLIGTLYMTSFRLVFVPDNEFGVNNLVSSGNRFISEYDIPFTSIYKINVAPVDSRSGFKSFLNENQIQSETRTFTIITRDFRNIIFTNCSVTKSNSLNNKLDISTSKMETYINALKIHSHFQDKNQLYPFLATCKPQTNNFAIKFHRSHTVSSPLNVRSLDDEKSDFCISNDERIKNYMIAQDWMDELDDANEKEWILDGSKFDRQGIIRDKGPFIRFAYGYENNFDRDFIWHWTHSSQVEFNRQNQQQRKSTQFMLLTIPGIGETPTPTDPLRLTSTDSILTSSNHYLYEQYFQRYNLSKFPCQLKRLQTSYEKLIEICVIDCGNDDDKWLTKLASCKWLKYVSKALNLAASLAKLLNYKNIQLAGSDIDNSCLISSLIQIIIRPKCRSIKGFCELIVREWIVRGHPFCERFGQVMSDDNGSPVQESPVFLLFLDCVHQLINQNPFAFEFTDYFLIQLYHSVCYCYHHTFAFYSIVERLSAIINYPKNSLVLSTFDFSLYLYPDICLLLKNDASVFNRENSVISSQQSTNRKVYRLEPPKSARLKIENIPTEKPLLPLDFDQFEFEIIESPQIFKSAFSVDWRIFNIDFWSQCYCRYDDNSMPTLREQQISLEINCFKDDIRKTKDKYRTPNSPDPFHSIRYANSWHPQTLDTRF